MTRGQRSMLAYVYAVGRDSPALDDAAVRAGTAGVADAPVHVVRAAGFGALVAAVPEDRYGEEGLHAQLADLDALERTARAHNAVVGAAFAVGTVLPMRLATVYRNDERVAQMLTAQARQFDTRLARLDGRWEWGVKVFADQEKIRAAAAAVDAEASPAGAGSPGRAYLHRRRAQRDDRRTAYRCAQELTGHVLDLAGEFAVAQVTHRPQQGALSPAAGENVANLAFLVPAEQGDAFCAALGALGGDGTVPGARVEITGPWAPYSFATTAPHGEGDADGR